MTKKTYWVTDKGGPRPDIAGSRRKVGEKLTLTESEARFELSRGMITDVDPAGPKPEVEDPPAAEAQGDKPRRGKAQGE